MLNLRLLYVLLEPKSIRTYLGLVAILGFGVLLDLIILLKVTLLVGPWITMAILAALSGFGVVIMYRVVESMSRLLLETVDNGEYEADVFHRYIGVLMAALFIVIPGILSTVLGGVVLAPVISSRLGRVAAETAGIDWRESYEYLRLDRMTGNHAEG